MQRLSLQWKFGLLVLSGLLVLFGLFAVLGSRLADDSARGMQAERLNTARLTAILLDQQFEEQFEELEWDASRLGAGDPSNEPARADLLRPNEPFITGLRFVDTQGIVRWSQPARRWNALRSAISARRSRRASSAGMLDTICRGP